MNNKFTEPNIELMKFICEQGTNNESMAGSSSDEVDLDKLFPEN